MVGRRVVRPPCPAPDIALLQEKLIGLLLLNLLVGELINTLLNTSIQIIKLIDVLCNFLPPHCTLLSYGRCIIIFVFKLSSVIISITQVLRMVRAGVFLIIIIQIQY